jgi:hypothetical protein
VSASTGRGWTDIAGLVEGAQRWGVAAVGQVADHVTRLAGATPASDAGGGAAPLDVEQAFEAAVDMARSLLREATAAARPPGGAIEPVTVTVAVGAEATATVWAHNTTTTASPPLQVRLTPPVDASGRTLAARISALDTEAVVVPAGGSHAFRFSVADARDVGTFHALALAEGAPELAVLVTVTVVPA